MIDNPAYKGVWAPRDIPNPDFFNDEAPLTHLGAVGAVAIEIWTMDDGYFFDNVVVSNSEEEATAVREATFAPKKEVEVRGWCGWQPGALGWQAGVRLRAAEMLSAGWRRR